MASRLARAALAAGLSGSLAGALVLAGTGTALADYGNTAVYQIEISANGTGPVGGGAWLWIELSSDQTGDYTGSDCGHGFFHGPGASGAAPDSGDVTWSSDGTWLTIKGVVLNGLGGLPITLKVKADYGHYVTTIFDISGLGFPGWAQVQVAP